MGVMGFGDLGIAVSEPAGDHLYVRSVVQGRNREGMPGCVGRRVMQERLVGWALCQFQQLVHSFPPIRDGRVTFTIARIEPEFVSVLFAFELQNMQSLRSFHGYRDANPVVSFLH